MESKAIATLRHPLPARDATDGKPLPHETDYQAVSLDHTGYKPVPHSFTDFDPLPNVFPSPFAPEAMYITGNVIIHSSSHLDLNGLRLYFGGALIIEEGATITGGEAVPLIPVERNDRNERAIDPRAESTPNGR